MSVRDSLKQFMKEASVREGAEERLATMMTLSDTSSQKKGQVLEKHEKLEMRHALIRHMRENPPDSFSEAPLPIPDAGGLQGMLSSFFGTILPRTAAFAVIFLVAGTGVSYAAQDTIPGDMLYPVKVSVMEPLQRSLAFSAEAKAELDARLALRRLEEVTRLAAENELTIEQSQHLNGTFLQHVESVEHHIEEVARGGGNDAAERLSDDLATQLQAHRAIIDTIGQDTKDNPLMDRVIQNVQQAQEQATRMRATHSRPSGNDQEAMERLREKAEDKISQAEDAVAELHSAHARTLTVNAAATAKLGAAEDLMVQAQASFEAGEHEEAAALARKALQAAEEGRLLLVIPVQEKLKKKDVKTDDEPADATGENSADEKKEEPETQKEQPEDDTNETEGEITVPVPVLPAVTEQIDSQLIGQ